VAAGWPLFWFSATVLFAFISAGFFLAAWRDEDRLLVVLSGSAFFVFVFFTVASFWDVS
jgi:hypothetical protein